MAAGSGQGALDSSSNLLQQDDVLADIAEFWVTVDYGMHEDFHVVFFTSHRGICQVADALSSRR